ncbi:hypothetical protein NDU88_000152 [Pleurodeles waltl]|uniref:Uncharacterized protein n=1 Tax=Pleurodeles waltl TaxID=8319 RepID=A0AAV7S623_PLEWA|nr:hypothetical protein NDU88_000152 [Pleurodeles waltl]
MSIGAARSCLVPQVLSFCERRLRAPARPFALPPLRPWTCNPLRSLLLGSEKSWSQPPLQVGGSVGGAVSSKLSRVSERRRPHPRGWCTDSLYHRVPLEVPHIIECQGKCQDSTSCFEESLGGGTLVAPTTVAKFGAASSQAKAKLLSSVHVQWASRLRDAMPPGGVKTATVSFRSEERLNVASSRKVWIICSNRLFLRHGAIQVLVLQYGEEVHDSGFRDGVRS